METHLSGLPDRPAMRLIVLAGQCRGVADPLAERFGERHRSLIPLAGQPLIAHVLRTAAAHPAVASLAVCIEREAFDPVWDMLTRLPGRGSVALVEARDNLGDSVRDAAQGWDGPLIVTTAGHALLSIAAIDAVAEALDHADAAIALTPCDQVAAAHRAAPRRCLSLRDGDFVPCDLYGMAGPAAIEAVEVFRGKGRFDRSGRRIRRAAGLLGLLLIRCRMLTLAAVAALVSRRLGLRLCAVVLPDGAQAIDVDDEHSYAAARDLLESRAGTRAGAVPAGEAVPEPRRFSATA